MNVRLEKIRKVLTLFCLVLSAVVLTSISAQAQCSLGDALTKIQVQNANNGTAGFTFNGSQISAVVTNTSPTCTYLVALESFCVDAGEFSLEAQVYKASDIRTLAPGASATLTVPACDCATQADIFVDIPGRSQLPITRLITNDALWINRLVTGYLFGCFCPPPDNGGPGCTKTQGYYKNHQEALPAGGLTLGAINYTPSQLVAILRTPVRGNCLVQLAHQLIAAKANIANGASAPAGVNAAIAAADTAIGSYNLLNPAPQYCPAQFNSSLNNTLTQYNEGAIGPGHCPD